MGPEAVDAPAPDAWGKLAAVLLEEGDREELCQGVCRKLVEDFGFSRALVATVDPDRGELVGRAGYDPSLIQPVARALVSLFTLSLTPREDGKLSVSVWCALRGEQVYIPDIRDYSFRPGETFAREFLVRVFGVEEVLLTPLLGPDGSVGMVAVDKKGQEAAIGPGERDTVRAVGALVGHALAARERRESPGGPRRTPARAGPGAGAGGTPADGEREVGPGGRDAGPVVRLEMAHDVLDTLPAGLVLLDSEGIVRYLNRTAASFLGVFPWDVMGKAWEEVFRPDRPEAFRRVLREGAGGEDTTPTLRRWTLRPPDGRERRAEVDVRHLEGEGYGGWIVLLLGGARAARRRNEFLPMLVHDLRSPAESVVGFAELLRMERVGPLNEDQQEFVSRIERSGQNMIRLAEDILDVEALESGRALLRRRPVDLRPVVREVMDRLYPQAREASVELREEMDGRLPRVAGDPVRLAQIFQNLVENAVEASRPGDVVRVRAAPGDGDGADRDGRRRLRVEVVDEGAGMEPDEAEALFDGERGWPTGGRRGSRGLGLRVARLLVEAHGGTIRAEGAPDRGLTVTFTLPAHQGEGDPSGPSGLPGSGRLAGEGRTVPGDEEG